MKKLLLFALISVTSIVAYSALAPATDKNDNTRTKNDVEYKRRGSLGTMDFVVSDVAMTNVLRRGTNTFAELEDDDALNAFYEPLYGTGVQYKRSSPYKASVMNPFTKEGCYAYWVIHQYGFEYANVEGKYDCMHQTVNGFNADFMWSTNVTAKTGNGKRMAFPKPETTDSDVKQDSLVEGTKVSVIADREWVVTILKAMKENKITFNADGSITIAE